MWSVGLLKENYELLGLSHLTIQIASISYLHTKNDDIRSSLFFSFKPVIAMFNEWKNEWTLISLVCVMNKILLTLIMKYSYLTFNWHRLRFYFWCLELYFESSKALNQLKVQAEYIYIIFFSFFGLSVSQEYWS